MIIFYMTIGVERFDPNKMTLKCTGYFAHTMVHTYRFLFFAYCFRGFLGRRVIEVSNGVLTYDIAPQMYD